MMGGPFKWSNGAIGVGQKESKLNKALINRERNLQCQGESVRSIVEPQVIIAY